MARTLIVGATGHLGQEMVKACKKQGHDVHALVRPATRKDAVKMKPLEDAGARIHEGDLEDYDSLLRACRGADSVISAIGGFQIGQEGALVKAVKEAGVRRFIPSDFGLDPVASGPGSCVLFDAKAAVHRVIKDSAVPYTFIHSNAFFTYWAFSLGDLTKLGGTLPPAEVNVYGDGDVQSALASVPDIAAVTVRALSDPKMQNKEVRITANRMSQNELVDLWQRKSGRKVKKITVPAAEVDKVITSSTSPDQGGTLVVMQLLRSVWIRGDSVKRVATSLEATELYPDIKFQSVDEGLTQLL